MQRRLTSVEAQVDRVLEAQIQAMQYQRAVHDRRYEETLQQLREMGGRLDFLEALDPHASDEDDDGDDKCAALNARMRAFERMAAASEEAMDYCLKKINKRVRSCKEIAKDIDSGMAEFVDHFNLRADSLEQCPLKEPARGPQNNKRAVRNSSAGGKASKTRIFLKSAPMALSAPLKSEILERQNTAGLVPLPCPLGSLCAAIRHMRRRRLSSALHRPLWYELR